MMNRLAKLWILVLISSLAGCGRSPIITAGTSSPLSMPPEFPIVGEAIAMTVGHSPDDFRDKEAVEIEADLKSWLLNLEGVDSHDPALSSIANQGRDALHDLVNRIERLKNLPQPPGFMRQLSTSISGGFYSGFTGDPSGAAGAWSSSLDAQEKQDAVISELRGFMNAFDKADTVHQLWFHVAQKYAALPSDPDGRIVVDIDAAWGSHGPYDWIKAYNGGADLENCTIQVLLFGKSSQSRKNVHFVRHWPASSWIYARYSPGEQCLDRKDMFRTTVTDLSKAEISVLSSRYTTTVNYTYQGPEKDKDIARWCQNLKLSGKYQPFVPGYVWNTERGIELTLDGIDSIPSYHADVAFRNGPTLKTWSWDHEGWRKGETKLFSPAKGELTFDPAHIDVSLSFPGTNYKHAATLTPASN